MSTSRPACRRCGARITVRELLLAGPPSPGDMAICHRCGDVVFYGEHGEVRSATLSDAVALPPDQRDRVLGAMKRRPS